MKLFFSLMLLGSTAWAGNILAPEMTCESLKESIKTKRISRVDSILREVPRTYLKNAALVYDSRAAKADLVSFETPRILLFNEDASMILSISRHPGETKIAEGKDSLEAICFDKKTLQFELLDLEMNGKDVPYADFEPMKNPPRCLGCHGVNPRPILQDYNSWPGFYGSFAQGGVAAHGSIEKENFLKFVKNAPNMARYEFLDLSNVQPDPYDKGEPDLSKRDLVYQDAKDYNFTPVAQLGQAIQRNMEYRLAAKLNRKFKSGDVPSIKSLLAYIGSDLNTCGGIRERIKDIYKAMVSQNNLEALGEELKNKLTHQIAIEFKTQKLEPTLKYNFASSKADSRGVISIPTSNSLAIYDPNYPANDSEAYMDQLVLLQAVGEFLGLTSEDISSFPSAPSLGLGHILRMGLYKDEQYFLGYTEAMISLDPFSLRRIENNCADMQKTAREQAKLLSFGGEPTLFAPSHSTPSH